MRLTPPTITVNTLHAFYFLSPEIRALGEEQEYNYIGNYKHWCKGTQICMTWLLHSLRGSQPIRQVTREIHGKF